MQNGPSCGMLRATTISFQLCLIKLHSQSLATFSLVQIDTTRHTQETSIGTQLKFTALSTQHCIAYCSTHMARPYCTQRSVLSIVALLHRAPLYSALRHCIPLHSVRRALHPNCTRHTCCSIACMHVCRQLTIIIFVNECKEKASEASRFQHSSITNMMSSIVSYFSGANFGADSARPDSYSRLMLDKCLSMVA